MTPAKTDRMILRVAEDLLAEKGFSGTSFDAIARRLGVSKQAVLYWYPSKRDLLAALFVNWLASEADVAEQSLADCTTPSDAVAAFVRALVGFHTENLDRFRMMYLAPQTLKTEVQAAQDREVLERVHGTTARLYGALAARLDGPEDRARRSAFAVHSSVLGLVLMQGLSESINDPLKHTKEDLVDALISQLVTSTKGSIDG